MPGSSCTSPPETASSSWPVAPGETANFAPAATDLSNCASVSTVPTPTTASGTSSAMARIACSPAPVRNVTSITGSPPFTKARASGTACFTSSTTITGMTGARRRMSARFMRRVP
jgi:hypothetical protein